MLRQLLTERLLIAIAATALGLALANQASAFIVALLHTSEEPIWVNLTFDWRVLLFALGMTLLTTLLFSSLPAWRSGNVNPAPTLKATSHAIRGAGGRWLVACQVGLAVLLVCGAALSARSLAGTFLSDRGFDSRNLLIVRVDPLGAGFSGTRLINLYTEAAERLRSLPGVQGASFSWVPPISNEMGGWWGTLAVNGVARDTRVFSTWFRRDTSRPFASRC